MERLVAKAPLPSSRMSTTPATVFLLLTKGEVMPADRSLNVKPKCAMRYSAEHACVKVGVEQLSRPTHQGWGIVAAVADHPYYRPLHELLHDGTLDLWLGPSTDAKIA